MGKVQYLGDLSVRRAKNGVIVNQSAGVGIQGDEFVFIDEVQFGVWMSEWMESAMMIEMDDLQDG